MNSVIIFVLLFSFAPSWISRWIHSASKSSKLYKPYGPSADRVPEMCETNRSIVVDPSSAWPGWTYSNAPLLCDVIFMVHFNEKGWSRYELRDPSWQNYICRPTLITKALNESDMSMDNQLNVWMRLHNCIWVSTYYMKDRQNQPLHEKTKSLNIYG